MNKENQRFSKLSKIQHRCLMFLSNKTDPQTSKEVIKMEPKLAKAQKIMDHINSTPQKIELCENRELTRMDIQNTKQNDKKEGREERIEIGREEEKIEIATNLKNMGLSIKDIAKATNLNTKLIKKL